MSPNNPTSAPTSEDCFALLFELGFTIHNGSIDISASANGFFVIIYRQIKRPAMIRFRGWPIEYHIGGGTARAYAGDAA